MKLRVIAQLLKMGIQIELRSKATVFSWFLVGIIPILSFILIWTNLLGENDKIGDFTRNDFILYYFLTTLTWFIVYGVFDRIIARGIKNGYLNRFLVKPQSFVMDAFLVEQGYKIISMFFAIPIFTILGLLLGLKVELDFSLGKIVALVISLALGAAVWSMFQAIVGSAAFWFNEIWAIRDINEVIVDLFAGLFIPLTLLPTTLQTIASFLPFKYMGYVPISIMLDKNTSVIGDLSLQLFWALVLFIVYKIVWTAGLKRYSGYGG